jgi:hypothetical protein
MRLVSYLTSLSLVIFGCAAGVVVGCASGDGGSYTSSGTPDGGPYRPPGNGQRVSEQVACDTLKAAFDQVICIGTSSVCPDLLRRRFGASCLAYDQGSVDGCVAAFSAKKDCAERKQAFDGCEITPFPGSAPTGCP